MNGIKMSDCKFYVNEDERVVVCVIQNTEFMFADYICNHFDWRDFYLSHIADDYMMPNSFMGKAVCSENDEWNEELGRKIAFSRAKDKCYRSFFKRANSLVNNIDRRLGEMVDSFNTFGDNLSKKKENLQYQIDQELDK